MKATLRQLQVFDAVAALGSVTRAADKLGMSQSAASKALSDLQIILGRPLFAHSKGRALEITDEGKRLQPAIKSLLAQMQEIERPQAAAPLSGRLVIGASALIAETALPHLCVEFMERYPEVEIQLEVDSVRTLLERLTRFELETALIEIIPEIEGIELTRWRTDELVLVAAPDHPLAGRKGLRIRDLAGYRWCTREANSSTTAWLRYLVHEQIGQLRVGFEATSNWAVRRAVIAGGGIGCLSRALVQYDLEIGRLRQLDMSDFRYTRALSLARPKGIWRSELSRTFDRFLLDHGEPAAADPSQ
ncbi:MAG: LysR family transcriptional regulator [Novosphingobium sp.]|nr:LysR family transcriptional regulator [Novosphingobium sp.]